MGRLRRMYVHEHGTGAIITNGSLIRVSDLIHRVAPGSFETAAEQGWCGSRNGESAYLGHATAYRFWLRLSS